MDLSDTVVELLITADGSTQYIHSDEAAAFCEELPLRTQRASTIEPDEQGQWWVDLSPVGGPRLGPYAPSQRARAVKDEIEWVRQHVLHLAAEDCTDDTRSQVAAAEGARPADGMVASG